MTVPLHTHMRVCCGVVQLTKWGSGMTHVVSRGLQTNHQRPTKTCSTRAASDSHLPTLAPPPSLPIPHGLCIFVPSLASAQRNPAQAPPYLHLNQGPASSHSLNCSFRHANSLHPRHQNYHTNDPRCPTHPRAQRRRPATQAAAQSKRRAQTPFSA